MPSSDDWLTAFDDGLRENFRACSLCGRSGVRLTRFDIVELPGLAIAAARCAGCHADEGGHAALEAKMLRRYALCLAQEESGGRLP